MSIWSALIGGAASLLGGAANNSANARQQNAANQFNAEQAAMSRDFNAEQAQITRDFNAAEADENREFNSAEAAATRGFNADQASINRQFQSTEAATNRDYQTQMANTSYQRGMADLKAAGLNPMLAYMKGGAATPSGAQASGSQASGPSASGSAASSSSASSAPASGQAARFNDVITPAINTGLQVQRNQAEVSMLDAQAQKLRAEAWTELRRPENVDASTFNLRSGGAHSQELARVANQQVGNILADTNLKNSQTDLAKASTDQVLTMIDQALAQTKLIGAQYAHTLQQAVTTMRQGDLYEAQTILARLQKNEAQASSAFFESTGETTKVAELARLLAVIFRSFK